MKNLHEGFVKTGGKKDLASTPRPAALPAPIRKISNFDDYIWEGRAPSPKTETCTHPHHRPSGYCNLTPGVYENVCPACGKITVFTVREVFRHE